jgi:hypothetical protein
VSHVSMLHTLLKTHQRNYLLQNPVLRQATGVAVPPRPLPRECRVKLGPYLLSLLTGCLGLGGSNPWVQWGLWVGARHRSDGCWIAVSPPSKTCLMTYCMHYMWPITYQAYRSLLHRVVHICADVCMICGEQNTYDNGIKIRPYLTSYLIQEPLVW